MARSRHEVDTARANPAYAGVYLHNPDTGNWTGEVAALGVEATGPTLEDARTAVEAAAVAAVQAQQGVGLAPGIPRSGTTVADRLEVTVFSMAAGDKKLVTARSHPSHGPRRSPYLDKDGYPLLRDSVVLVIDELGSTSWMTGDIDVAAMAKRAELLRRTRE